MATFGTSVRRGLPRVAGGEQWPPAGEAPIEVAAPVRAGVPEAVVAADSATDVSVVEQVQRDETPDTGAATPVEVAAPVATAAPERQEVTPEAWDAAPVVHSLRRGLPRVAGGEPWPPAGVVAVAAGVSSRRSAPRSTSEERPVAAPALDAAAAASPAAGAAPSVPTPVTPAAAVAASDRPLRRGLPRVAGGDPWPPAGFAPVSTVQLPHTAESAVAGPQSEASERDVEAPVAAPAAPAAKGRRTGLPRPGAAAAPAAAASVPAAAAAAAAPAAAAAAPVTTVEVIETPVPPAELAPLPFTRTAWAGEAATSRPAPKEEPKRYGPFTKGQWAGAVIVAGAGLLFAAAMAVLLVRWFLSLDFMQEFLTAFPGEYHLPAGAPVGFPAWLGWQHFFNVFLMVLIIRSGLQIRTEKRPTAFWTPRWSKDGRGKVSLNIWFHQSLDILWLVNGVIFVVLLFITGQWMRIIPTSWEVFPNALSAGLQYVSLDWPTENGWVNYNSLQQLAYFATVFLAAPLAAITGARMSGIWPKNATGLNKAYPIEWARAVHFPVMLYFVVFIAIHVFLVFATGALRNLNHMYAAQGSPDPTAYEGNWAGFWWFVASLVVIAAAWIAARPLVLAPIARLFGKVSGR